MNESNETPIRSEEKVLYDELTKTAVKQLMVSDSFKKPLLEKWKEYENLRAGKIKKKLRTPFQVAFPIFSGMLDTLAASFDEAIELEFYHTKPADYFKAKNYQGAWNTEKSKTTPNAQWDYKARVDKDRALITGRGIETNFAEANPTYKNHLEIIDPIYFHCQPDGGGKLENHLFAGREDIFKTESELGSDIYDQDQVNELKVRAGDKDYIAPVGADSTQKLMRFKALNLNPEQNNYVGETVYNLVEWEMEHKGKRYYLLFDPYTATWIRGGLLQDVLYPKESKKRFKNEKVPFSYTSWATHEDLKVFWSKSYADDFYGISDTITTLFNQELTNREKRNLGARGYDKDMFPDVGKLDAAQYRPDALVPIDTKGGTRRIDQGIYHFQTPELQGTITLLDWIQTSTAKDTGISDIAQGSSQQASKKANVAFMEQASVAKRIGYKSQSYSECWGEIGYRYALGLKSFMTEKMAIQVLGDGGLEWEEISRDDLDLEGDIGVRVISSTSRKEESKQKKVGRVQALKMIAEDQSLLQTLNPQWKAATILRDVGEYDDDEIKIAMDTKNYASKEQVAKAHIAIQKIISGMTADINYSANSVFLKIIRDFAIEHKDKLKPNVFATLWMYFNDSSKLAMMNAQISAPKGEAPAQTGAGQGQPTSTQASGAGAPAPVMGM